MDQIENDWSYINLAFNASNGAPQQSEHCNVFYLSLSLFISLFMMKPIRRNNLHANCTHDELLNGFYCNIDFKNDTLKTDKRNWFRASAYFMSFTLMNHRIDIFDGKSSLPFITLWNTIHLLYGSKDAFTISLKELNVIRRKS